MTVRTHVLDTEVDAGTVLAARIASLLAEHDPSRPFLLGCPAGRSPRPVYAALAAAIRSARANAAHMVIVMMDEYVLTADDGTLSLPDRSAHYSCRRFARREILNAVNSGLPPSRGIPVQNLWMPDLADPMAYDTRIADAGGIDFFILASGAGDGHVAFNAQGSARESKTRVVQLADQTRRDNLATFPDFPGLTAVPTHGVTVGISTIADLSKEAGMILWGNDKKTAYRRISEATDYNPSWPATVLAACRNASLYADRAATQ